MSQSVIVSYATLNISDVLFRWKKTQVADTGSITEYDLPGETDLEVADVVQISEKKSQFDVDSKVKEGEKNGQENSALELEEDTAGFTIW